MIIKAMTVGACLVLAGCAGSSGQDPAKEVTGHFLGAVATGDYPPPNRNRSAHHITPPTNPGDSITDRG